MIAMRRFYRMLFDHTIANQWFLDEARTATGELIDGWHFTTGRPYRGPSPQQLAVYKSGIELALTSRH
jgi:hypothetical protein